MRPSRNRLSTSNQRRVEISERKTWRKNGWPGSVLLSSPFFSLTGFPSLTYAVHYFKRNSPSRPSSPFIAASLSVCSFPVRLPSLDLPASVYAANLRVVPLGRTGCHSYRTLFQHFYRPIFLPDLSTSSISGATRSTCYVSAAAR